MAQGTLATPLPPYYYSTALMKYALMNIAHYSFTLLKYFPTPPKIILHHSV